MDVTGYTWFKHAPFQNRHRPFSLIMRCGSVKLVPLCVNDITAAYHLRCMPVIWDTAHDRPILLRRTRVTALLISIWADICISHTALERVLRSDAQMNNGWLWEGLLLLTSRSRMCPSKIFWWQSLKILYYFRDCFKKKYWNNRHFYGCSYKSLTLKPEICHVSNQRFKGTTQAPEEHQYG